MRKQAPPQRTWAMKRRDDQAVREVISTMFFVLIHSHWHLWGTFHVPAPELTVEPFCDNTARQERALSTYQAVSGSSEGVPL